MCMDGMLPEPNSVTKSEERMIRIIDMKMMSMFDSRERELDDFKALFTSVGSRLKIRNVVNLKEASTL